MTAQAASAFDDRAVSSAKFLVEVDGVDIGRYEEVSGLTVQLEVHEYSEGGVNGHVHHFPGRMTWPNLVLKRGITNDDNLLAWFHRAAGQDFAANGSVARSTAAVTLVSAAGERLRSWELIDAVPVRWSGPTLASSSDGTPVEELEVAHHGFQAQTY